jgi:phosphate transport system ATP-binding protein
VTLGFRRRSRRGNVTTVDAQLLERNDVTQTDPAGTTSFANPVFDLASVTARYGAKPAVANVSLQIARNKITAIIGPSGCGKSTLLRCMNRMNDLITGASVEGKILYNGQDLYADDVDPAEVRRRIGMVFQRPNPFPRSIYDNIAFGPRINGMRSDLDDTVETALRRAALWDEVKDKLRSNAYSLSGGQQQRLCIARALAVEPDVLLMDEPCSALDPIATTRIEDLMQDLKRNYSIIIVTHNMQQAARTAEMTAFLTVEVGPAGERTGILVEYDATSKIFTMPTDKRTEDYVTGRVG